MDTRQVLHAEPWETDVNLNKGAWYSIFNLQPTPYITFDNLLVLRNIFCFIELKQKSKSNLKE